MIEKFFPADLTDDKLIQEVNNLDPNERVLIGWLEGMFEMGNRDAIFNIALSRDRLSESLQYLLQLPREQIQRMHNAIEASRRLES